MKPGPLNIYLHSFIFGLDIFFFNKRVSSIRKLGISFGIPSDHQYEYQTSKLSDTSIFSLSFERPVACVLSHART